jgi:putative aminopeptidase FrvX
MRALQLVGVSIPFGCITILCRYIRPPSEILDSSDVQSAVKIVNVSLRTLNNAW